MNFYFLTVKAVRRPSDRNKTLVPLLLRPPRASRCCHQKLFTSSLRGYLHDGSTNILKKLREDLQTRRLVVSPGMTGAESLIQTSEDSL